MKYFFIVLSLLLFTLSRSQNLVPNPSFETYTLCPTNSCNVELYATSWTSATANGSTDYFNTCSPSCKLSTNNARTGNGYAGLFFLGASSSASNTRDYLQVQLINPLVQNISYYVEFFVMLRNISLVSGCNNISVNFSITRPFTTNWGVLQPLTPHITNPGNPIIDDKINWVKVSGCYTAQGGEEYLTIGNFMDDAHTQTTGTTTTSYYLVDDVLIEEMTGGCSTGLNELSINDLKLFPNPTTGMLYVKLETRNESELQIKIIDLLGREIKEMDYKEEVDISDLEKGIYFLSIYQEKKLLVTKNIVKE